MRRPSNQPGNWPGAARDGTAQDGGFALLLVLLTLVPVSLLFVLLAASARSEAQLTANLREAAALEAAADGAIYTAVFELLQPGGAVGNGASAFAGPPGATVRVEVVSQSGLVNPNIASPDLLGALLVRLGVDPGRAYSVAGAVVEWRTPVGRARGKAARYRAAGLGYGPPGEPFESLGELGEVLGMTPAMLAALAPHLTLYSDSDPDPAAADPVVRAALRDAGSVGAAGQAGGARVVSIAAVAERPDGGRAVRRAVIRIGRSPNRRDWRVLAWDTLRGP